MPTAAKSRDEVLAIITATFRKWGYDGASLSKLAQATGLVKASLYHYFPKGKPDMAKAVLDKLTDDFCKVVLAPLGAAEGVEAKGEALRGGLETFYQQGKAGCLLDIFSLGTAHELFGDEVRNVLISMRDAFAKQLIELGFDMGAAVQRAEKIMALFQGALILARATSDPSLFRSTIERIPEELKK